MFTYFTATKCHCKVGVPNKLHVRQIYNQFYIKVTIWCFLISPIWLCNSLHPHTRVFLNVNNKKNRKFSLTSYIYACLWLINMAD